ncbi:MAG: exodeoxyribonuclease V subunit gamma, partial [Gammaproteobacteria bacterium]
MTFHLHTANRLERLADALADRLREAPLDPFAEIPVTVAHPGMARWLEIRLAEALGVVMRFDWPLPGRTVWRLLRATTDSLPEEDPLEKPRLALRLWAGLRAGTLRLPDHLVPAEDPDGLRAWRIADALAEAFDQYPLYRPDWVREWDEGRPGFGGDRRLIERFGWQAEAWRRLTAGIPHRLRLVDRLLRRLQAGERPDGLPHRLFLFGLSHLPPLYLRLFVALGKVCEVHAFVLTPSQEWWGDAPNRRETRARLLAGEDVVHPLLAQWGREARDFIDLLYAYLDEVEHTTDEHFTDDEPAHTLGRVQAHLRTLEAPAEFTPDASLVVHATHGPMRACQEAIEAILAARRHDPSLKPREIALLCTDIDRYAPYLEAAFEALQGEARMPHAIVDRRADQELPLLATIQELLRLPTQRVTAVWVRALLDDPAVRRRFGIDEALLPELTDWLQRHGVRWGLDEIDRRRLGFAGRDRHSLAYGAARALAGYALGADDYALFEGIAPAEGMEGDLAEAVGGLLELADRLRRWRERLTGPHRLSDWCRLVAELVADLTHPDAEALEQLAPLHDALATLEQDAALLALETPVSAALFRTWLAARTATPRVTEGYLAGSITCCALQPLRNLPFRHIHVLGLNDADFPRRDHRSALDALTFHNRRGDRSPRDDDRLMLLETLLAARDALHLHYVYRDPRDDTERPPATPIVELLDYLHGEEVPPERSSFVVTHPMQPFSPRRYTGSVPAHDPFWFAIARGLTGERRPSPPLGDAPAGLPEGLEARLDLDDLARFLSAPLTWFTTRGLGLPREEALPELEEHERFRLDGLEGYRVRERLARAFEEGRDLAPEAIRERLGAEGLLPEGPAGDAAWMEQAGQWQRLERRLVHYWGRVLPPAAVHLPFQFEEHAFVLQGWLESLHEKAGALRVLKLRLGDPRPKDWMALWVETLAACATGQPIVEGRTVARQDDPVLRPLEPEQARAQLRTLAALAIEGLTRPLPVAPEAVVAWALGEP